MNYRAGYFTHYAGEGTIRRCYHGSEQDVLDKNEMARFRYRDMMKRITVEDYDD